MFIRRHPTASYVSLWMREPNPKRFWYHGAMKRDMDLVRDILGQIEGRGPGRGGLAVSVKGRSDAEISGHLEIMDDAGLVDGVDPHGGIACRRLTWEGHEFLEQSRDEGMWERAKDKAIAQTGSLSMLAIKTALATLIKAAITGG